MTENIVTVEIIITVVDLESQREEPIPTLLVNGLRHENKCVTLLRTVLRSVKRKGI